MKVFSIVRYILLCLVCASATLSFGKVTHGTSNGNWNSSGTWDNGIPACGDSVYIDKDITVTVSDHVNLEEASTPACSSAVIIIVNGVLKFSTGKKLYLSCNSRLFVTSDGELKKGGGGGSANLIDICQTTVWKAGDGDQSGPIPIGPGLPIKLEFFKASLDGDVVKLSWATQSEINNDYFTIQRSSALIEVEDVIYLPGAGNSKQRMEYEEIDALPLNGVSYYRLKQTDFNGVITFSNWVSVNYSVNHQASISIINNHASEKIYLECKELEGQQGKLIVSDFSGRIIKSETQIITSNSFVWTVDLGTVSSNGMYLIRLQAGDKEEAFKFFKGQ